MNLGTPILKLLISGTAKPGSAQSDGNSEHVAEFGLIREIGATDN